MNDKYDCAVEIEAIGNHVSLENITVKNVPEGVTAICIYGGSVTLKNVHVSNVNGDAIRIFEGAILTKIESDCSISGAKRGIVVDEVGLGSNNLLYSISTAIDLTKATVDEHGFIDIPNSQGKPTFSIEAISGEGTDDWFVSKSNIKLVTTYKNDKLLNGEKFVEIRGKVVELPDGDSTVAMCKLESKGGISRIHVYSVGGLTEDNVLAKAGFVGYVGTKPEVGSGGLLTNYGIKEDGTFKFLAILKT